VNGRKEEAMIEHPAGLVSTFADRMRETRQKAASDATLIFVGSSLVLAALRGSAGCEFLALSNWLLHRTDQIACAVFTPIDSLERLRSRS
jgi:hypothetical protein